MCDAFFDTFFSVQLIFFKFCKGEFSRRAISSPSPPYQLSTKKQTLRLFAKPFYAKFEFNWFSLFIIKLCHSAYLYFALNVSD